MDDVTRTVDLDLFHEVHDFDQGVESFRLDVLAGLAKTPKSIPPKHFYDRRGSELFDRICSLPEYYPTRTERQILIARAPEIARLIGPDVAIVEPGAGALEKVRIVIGALDRPRAYVPVDISGAFLLRAAESFARDHPELATIPVTADFTHPFDLPALVSDCRRVGFFPGSTIGNLTRDEAIDFLTSLRATLGAGSALLIGVDRRKSPDILIPAYNDSEGTTAAFNLNLLSRINAELEGDFDLSRFAHRAIWNDRASRIEMHLESLTAQTVTISGHSVAFDQGETIHTENSHKYAPDAFEQLVGEAGWTAAHHWSDADSLFSVWFLTA